MAKMYKLQAVISVATLFTFPVNDNDTNMHEENASDTLNILGVVNIPRRLYTKIQQN